MKIKVTKEDIKKFDESNIGIVKNKYLKRSIIIGILLIMFGLSYILLNLYNNVENILDYIIAIVCILFGIYFIINSNIIKKKEVNRFIYEKKSKK